MTTPWPSQRGETKTDRMDLSVALRSSEHLTPTPTPAISVLGSFLCFWFLDCSCSQVPSPGERTSSFSSVPLLVPLSSHCGICSWASRGTGPIDSFTGVCPALTSGNTNAQGKCGPCSQGPQEGQPRPLFHNHHFLCLWSVLVSLQ